MADPDYKPEDFNAMQANMGLTPQGLAPLFSARTPAEYAAAVSQQAMFQTQQNIQMAAVTARPMPTFTTGPQIYQGPGGILMPQGPAVPNQLFPTQQSMATNFMAGAGFGGNRFSQGASPYQSAYVPPSPGFGQIPTSGFPFAGALPSPQFNTPFGASFQRQESAYASTTSAMATTASLLGGRLGSDAMTGGALGGYLGFKTAGFRGGIAGGLLGMAGADYAGVGDFGQNAFMSHIASPYVAQAGRANAVQGMSQSFLSGGGYLSGTGAGFSEHASRVAARGLTNLSTSSAFETETGGRFNTQDVFRIAQESSHAGLMQGVGSPEQMAGRVREIAKSLKAFMELANEPDIRDAIQTMGSMRGMGLNLGQTMDAVSQGRSFARMAGTTFQNLASQGGAIGAQTFSSMGLTQGMGLNRGMFNQGIGTAMANAGVHSAQMMNLMGGAEGYAASNTMFSGGFLQMPMMAPGMMNARGSLDPRAIQNMMQGRTNIFDMTSRGASMLSTITGQHGIEGLGTALAMQPLLQDSLARVMTPEQQRNAENRTMLSHMRSMGYSGGGGFVMAGMQMGMNDRQALGRARELGSSSYYDTLRRQSGARASDEMSQESDEIRARAPGMMNTLSYQSEWFAAGRRGVQSIGRGFDNFVGNAMGEHLNWAPSSETERRDYDRHIRGNEYAQHLRSASNFQRELTWHDSWNAAKGRGGGGLGAGMAALVGGTSNDRRDLALMREGGDIADTLMTTTEGDARESMSRMGNTFGSGRAGMDRMSRFAGAAANIFNGTERGTGTSAAWAGATMFAPLGGGFMRNMIGGSLLSAPSAASTRTVDIAGQLQRAYIQNSGLSRDEALARYEREKSTIYRQASGLVGLMTGGRSSDIMAELQGQAGSNVDLHAAAANERRRGMGLIGLEDNVSNRRDVRDLLNQNEFEEGVGSTEEQRRASRGYMMALKTASLAGHQGTEADSERANARLQEIHRQMSAAGISASDISDMEHRAQQSVRHAATTNEAGTSRVARQLLNRTNSPADMLRVVRDMQGAEMNALGDEQIAGGINSMSRYHNQFTDSLFSGVGNGNLDRLTQNARGMSLDDIRRAKNSDDPVVRQAARAAEQARTGDTGAIRTMLRNQGQRDSESSREFEETYGGVRGFGKRVMGLLNDETPGLFETYEEFQGRHPETGRARRRHTRNVADIDAMQQEAGDAGIGGAADHLNQAATSLEQVIRDLREMNGERSILDRTNDT